MARKPAAGELDFDSRVLQRQLKALGVEPPPPPGKPRKPGILQKGEFYAIGGWDAKHAYLQQLRAVFDGHRDLWTPEAHLHTVLAVAQKAAPASERLTVCHKGVPARPVIANAGYVALCVLAADAVADLVPARERTEFRTWVELARPVREREALSTQAHQHLDEKMDTWHGVVAATTPALILAQSAALAAADCSGGSDAGKVTRQAVGTAVAMRVAAAAPVRPLLEAIDALILKEDALTQLTKMKQQPRGKLVASTWRAAAGGKTTHWLVELEHGFALWWKLRGQWRLVEGERDEVLASVPDAQMASALAAVLGG